MRVKAKLRLVRVIAVVAPVAPLKRKIPDLYSIHRFLKIETELRLFCRSSVYLLCLNIKNDIIYNKKSWK